MEEYLSTANTIATNKNTKQEEKIKPSNNASKKSSKQNSVSNKAIK